MGVKDFRSNYWVPIDELDTVRIDGELSDEFVLTRGDVLTVRSNGNKQLIGRCIVAANVPEKVSHSGFTIRIRVHSSEIEPTYLAHYLKSRVVRETLVKSGGGANISSLSQGVLSTLPVPLPLRREQSRIVSEIETVSSQVDRLASIFQHKHDSLVEIKQSILHKAFTGELTADGRTLSKAGV